MGTLGITKDIKNQIAGFFAAAMVALAGAVLLAPSVGAISMANVSPARGAVELVEGETLKLVVTANLEAGEELRELEVDHSYDNTNPLFPEFSVYANESDPYNDHWADPAQTGQEAIFASLGASVTYSASDNQWVLDFGTAITDIILEDGGDVTFHFVLRGVNTDTEAAISWGSMSPITPDNTFAYSLEVVEADEAAPGVEADEAAPGVPNTATAGPTASLLALAGIGAVVVLATGVAAYRYNRS